MRNKRLHGLHNTKVCDLLIQNGSGDYNDWIVTTAFYAALHFVHHHLFPIPINRRNYKNFESYYNGEYPDSELPKHTVTRNLVKEYIPEISSKYNWLFKECHNARYIHYNTHGDIANTAKGYLEEIKNMTED